MFALILSAALATAPAPTAAQPAMDCTQSSACLSQAQMSAASCSMGSMPGMTAPSAKHGNQGNGSRDLYSGRK